MTYSIETLYKTMNEELKKVTLWLTANKLSLNVNKAHFMTFKAYLILSENPTEKVNYKKFLGLLIEELSLKYYINYIAMKVSKNNTTMTKSRHN